MGCPPGMLGDTSSHSHAIERRDMLAASRCLITPIVNHLVSIARAIALAGKCAAAGAGACPGNLLATP